MGGALLRPGMTRIPARPVLLPAPQQRSLLRHEHIIARWLTQSAPSRTRDLAEAPAVVRLSAEPRLRLAPGAKFRRLPARATASGAGRTLANFPLLPLGKRHAAFRLTRKRSHRSKNSGAT